MIQLDGKQWHYWESPVFMNGTVTEVRLFSDRPRGKPGVYRLGGFRYWRRLPYLPHKGIP